MKRNENKSDDVALRQAAEEVLKTKQPRFISELSESNILKLIHELEVHQIELEMQNEELRLSKNAEKQAVEKYTELYDFAPTGYFTLSTSGEIIELNFAGAAMLGMVRSHLKNRQLTMFISNNSKSIFIQFLAKVFKSNSKEVCEVVFQPPNETPVDVYITGVAIANAQKCLITAIDISERKQMENDLIFARKRAEESDKLKSAFLNNMSHEIRTPMNSILGFSRLIVRHYNNKSKLEKFSEIIKQGSNDLLNIVNDILDIAKIESGQLSVNYDECNLNELFEELRTIYYEFQERNNNKNIKLSLQAKCNPSELVILADRIKLKQILINLINNAFKFTENGHIEGGCKLDENQNLVFYVADTGIGIPPEEQKLIFDRFTQLSQGASRKNSGTGLGLSIVNGLIKLLKGEIWIESQPGKGSIFSFTIPYTQIIGKENKISITEKTDYYNFQNKTILLVEDDNFSIEYIREILENTGVNLIFADTGIKAVRMAKSTSFDLILMDIRLPDMNGYETTKQIKQIKPHANVIAQTAYASALERRKAIDFGFTDYISKPIDIDLLLAKLDRHLH